MSGLLIAAAVLLGFVVAVTVALVVLAGWSLSRDDEPATLEGGRSHMRGKR